ncbi:alpha/beta fold hydrolase [Flammeovirga sp. EKP202]|uniref:alpha/beta fold hydrolase n=1 Tax=Flammeovirga sp. EKP202 TaxID=2770592 RepID=UPI00165F6FD2|nr:alpha/beta hydrolase [Flammeovirga sp. EKP202]MBD0404718.1 alpha/beta hydrolase [Flammeovirga sp. EKP202]
MKDHLLKNPSFHYYNSHQNNKRIIICIHGYGQRAEIFKILSNQLSQYAILSIDLPFHGSNNSNNNIHLLWRDLKVYLEGNDFDEINLLGYSIGSRLATFFYSQAPQLFQEIYLIAPDGIAKNPLFPVVTHTFVAPIFRFAMSKQKVIHNALELLANFRLIKQNLFQFASKSLGSPQESEKVANTWIALRDTQLKNKKLLTILLQHNTKLYLLVGQKDKIITVRKVSSVARKLPKGQTIYFDANHYQVLIESIQWITEKKTSQK